MSRGRDRPRRRLVEPIEVDPVPVVAVGTAIWAALFVLGLIFREHLRSAGHDWWISAALAGALLGLVGLYTCARRRRAGDVTQQPDRPR